VEAWREEGNKRSKEKIVGSKEKIVGPTGGKIVSFDTVT
jgi:hypothetical protein